jgi:hypothetical protein
LVSNKRRKLLKEQKEQHQLNQLETQLKLHHHLLEIKKLKLHQKQQPHHQLVSQQLKLKLNLLLEKLLHLQLEKLLHHLQENLSQENQPHLLLENQFLLLESPLQVNQYHQLENLFHLLQKRNDVYY